jgi:hypothetical protein
MKENPYIAEAEEVTNIDDCETHFITDRNAQSVGYRAEVGETIKMCKACINSYVAFVNKVLKEMGE